MTLSDQTAALRRTLYENRRGVPLLLYAAALVALLVSRPFGIWAGGWVLTALCTAISMSGVAIRALTAGYLPRKSEEEAESGIGSTSLQTQGMYAVVRHPVALGNLLAWYGILLYIGVTWFIVGAGLLYTLFTWQVLLCEEEELEKRFGHAYSDWARESNALIPNLRRRSTLPGWGRFSPGQAIRREYIGFFCVVFSFVTIDLLKHRVIDFEWSLSPFWSAVGGGTLLLTLLIGVILRVVGK